MGMVKKVKKFIFNPNFSFYFKFLAINGTEKTRLCPQLVIEFLGGCPQLVTEICGGSPQLVTEKVSKRGLIENQFFPKFKIVQIILGGGGSRKLCTFSTIVTFFVWKAPLRQRKIWDKQTNKLTD